MNYVNTYWDYDKCKNISEQFDNRTDFQKKYKGAYEFARLNGFLEDICNHMIVLGDMYKRCIYAFEFNDNHVYVGLTFNINTREKDHLNDEKSQVYKHIKSTNSKYNLIRLTDYIPVVNARFKEQEYVKLYEKKGWTILNSAKAGGTGGTPIKWSKDKCKKEALKYNHRNDFRKGSRGAYELARRNKWLDDICNHMTPILRKT
jgi:predicted GIY-YIG superfamily endonuclease